MLPCALGTDCSGVLGPLGPCARCAVCVAPRPHQSGRGCSPHSLFLRSSLECRFRAVSHKDQYIEYCSNERIIHSRPAQKPPSVCTESLCRPHGHAHGMVRSVTWMCRASRRPRQVQSLRQERFHVECAGLQAKPAKGWITIPCPRASSLARLLASMHPIHLIQPTPQPPSSAPDRVGGSWFDKCYRMKTGSTVLQDPTGTRLCRVHVTSILCLFLLSI